MINRLMVTAAARWAAQGLVAYLLGTGVLAPADAPAWTTTFINLFLSLVSVALLAWTIVQNRWPNLVNVVSSLPQVDKVGLNRGVVMTQPLKDNPSVVVSANSQHVALRGDVRD